MLRTRLIAPDLSRLLLEGPDVVLPEVVSKLLKRRAARLPHLSLPGYGRAGIPAQARKKLQGLAPCRS